MMRRQSRLAPSRRYAASRSEPWSLSKWSYADGSWSRGSWVRPTTILSHLPVLRCKFPPLTYARRSVGINVTEGRLKGTAVAAWILMRDCFDEKHRPAPIAFSNGWLANVKARRGLQKFTAHGESAPLTWITLASYQRNPWRTARIQAGGYIHL